MKEKKYFFLLEEVLYKIEDESMFTGIQGFNPIHEEIKNTYRIRVLLWSFIFGEITCSTLLH